MLSIRLSVRLSVACEICEVIRQVAALGGKWEFIKYNCSDPLTGVDKIQGAWPHDTLNPAAANQHRLTTTDTWK